MSLQDKIDQLELDNAALREQLEALQAASRYVVAYPMDWAGEWRTRMVEERCFKRLCSLLGINPNDPVCTTKIWRARE